MPTFSFPSGVSERAVELRYKVAGRRLAHTQPTTHS